MKWTFYVIVFVYMFYRTVYGAKVPDSAVSLDLNGLKDGDYIEVGETKNIICKGAVKNKKLQWINPNGQVVPQDRSRRVYASQFSKSIRAGSFLILTFKGTAVEDSGVWTCRSGDAAKGVSVCVIDTLSFNGTSATVDADEGRTSFLSCHATGNPEPRISWYRNGEEISDDDNSDSKYKLMTKHISDGMEGLLTIMSLSSDDSGVYTCNAIQESYLATDCSVSKTFNITLNVNRAPSFEDDSREKVYGKEGETLIIPCEADGYPPPSYQWFEKEDDELTELSDDAILIPNDNGTDSVLTLKVTEDTYDKEYICRVNNSLGEKEKVYTILKPRKPEVPSEVELVTTEHSNTLMFNITWEKEILFAINEIHAQFLPAARLRRKHKPKETDWRVATQAIATIGDVEDYGTLAILSGLEKATEYWVRLRIKNTAGDTKWSEPIKASTTDEDENEDAENEEEEEENEEDVVASSTSGEEEDETKVSEDDSLVTTQSPPSSDDSGKFYGLFFGVGAVLLIVACTFLMRMV